MQVLGVMQDQEWFVFPEVNEKILEYVTEWIESLEGYFAFMVEKNLCSIRTCSAPILIDLKRKPPPTTQLK